MNSNQSKGTIYFGGSIITMNDNQPIVKAIGIEGEKIVSIGNLEEVKNKMGKKCKLIDLKGNTLLPGFIDCHIHPIPYLLTFIYLNLKGVNSLHELQNILKETAKGKKKNDFIFGMNLMEEGFEIPIPPTRWDLDEACPENPVFLMKIDGHSGFANSKALELARINRETIAPKDGEIVKDENGEPTGILTERMLITLMKYVPLPERKIVLEAASKVFNILAENGITSIHGIFELDNGPGNLGSFAVPILKNITDRIHQNLYSIFFTTNAKKLNRIKKSPLDDNKKDGKFKVGGIKEWFDGSYDSLTAYMFESYTDYPKKNGFCVIEEEVLYKRMVNAHNLGYQIAIHAIGDKANRIVVDLYKKLLTEFPREDHRHRIEHASILSDEVIKDIKELGIITSCQPAFINLEYTWVENRLGKERIKYTYPYRSLLDAGVVIASGSDAPVDKPNVILGLYGFVTRSGFVPEQCISMEEALKTYTINGAYASFEEDIKGSIEEGKLADLVILNKNPFKVSNDEIKEIQVLETIIRGKTVYKK
ncbi:MAG: amidohydrolase [Promethearchaeota archaeon]